MPRKVLRSPRSARKERRKTKMRVILYSVLIVAVFGGIAYAFSRPEFRIQKIEVSGTARVTEESIVASVERQISGAYLGFIPKSHTLLYPKSRVRESLLQEFPAFSGISVSLKNLAALRVSVREREPYALWCSETCYLMDETGFVFGEAEAGTENLYYRFEQQATTTPIGTTVLEQERLLDLMSFLKQLEKMDLHPERIVLGEEQEVEFILQSGVRLLVNEKEYDRSRRNLQALLAQNILPREGGKLTVTYVDLRYGNKIYFKPR